MIRTVVVDDEPVARRGLRRLLDAEADLDVVGEARDGPEALEVIRSSKPDVVFLDIEMPGLDGVAVAAALEAMDHPPLVVFVTAYDRYALRAFEVEAADYVLKPFDRERLGEVMARVRRRLRRAALDDVSHGTDVLRRVLGGAGTEPERLVLREDGAVFLLRPDQVDLVEAAGNYVSVHVGRRTHRVRESLTAIEERLEAHGFLRVSRSALVNLARVREVHPGGGGTYTAVLEQGRRIAVSRRSAQALRQAIEKLR